MSMFSGIQGAGGATSIAAIGNNYIAQRNTTLDTIRVGRCDG